MEGVSVSPPSSISTNGINLNHDDGSAVHSKRKMSEPEEFLNEELQKKQRINAPHTDKRKLSSTFLDHTQEPMLKNMKIGNNKEDSNVENSDNDGSIDNEASDDNSDSMSIEDINANK